ncbi:MAG: 3'-5' exonuclease [Myxococcales bacterium]|nr:3'-5' exonuclease [Myxococcales bacterium]
MPVRDPKTVYFCVDLEASGPVPGLFNMISVGAVVVRLQGDGHVRGAELYREVVPEFPGWDPETEPIHKLTRAHLAAHGVSTKQALSDLEAFVKANLQPGERPLFVGHNAPFDWMFVAWHYAWAERDNPFGYNALDTKALFMGRHMLPWKQCNKERLAELYPQLQPPPAELVHNAVADARFQADILIALLDG